jgi:hypothetical protein
MRPEPLKAVSAAAIVMFALLAAGCDRQRAIEATTVLSDEHCQGLPAGVTPVTWIDVDALRHGHLLGNAPPATNDARDEDLLLFAISRGEQPTGGYVLRLEAIRREPGGAVIDIHWSMPPADAMVAQVITHPCLVVGIPQQHLDGLQKVEVRDQHGTLLGSAAR